MEKIYHPHTIEQKWYQTWESANYFAPQPQENSVDKSTQSSKEKKTTNNNPYCIMIPPPNVTGRLHMGHGFQDTLMDTLTRYHRMRGEQTLWQMGTDHAGISTQMVVERELAKQNISRHDLGREKFVKRIWEWKEEFGGIITQQLRRMGTSVDWTRERFTLDDGMSEAVLDVFVKLYDEGLIYRGKRLVNWDPNFRSAVSDLEVINQEEDGHMWHIRYPLADRDCGHDHLIVATTRPETMLGDVAVAVHPEDERYKDLIGHQLQLPLTDRLIPIIADDYVDPEFGSGCVKITPAHDFNDYEVGQRHQLPQINIFTETAHINENAPNAYQGLERFEARKQVVSDLEKLGLMEKIEPHKLSVPHADRGNAVIEPYLTNQWYVKAKPLAEPAIEAVKSGRIKMVPPTWKKTYFQWMENIQDWCISRQLWWGHRIPAWYDKEGNIYVAHNETEVRKKYKLDDTLELRQEEDVLDTWFSSALWPFSTLGWPKDTESFKTFYPTSVLITGFDIIFFWVARMIMMGLKFTGEVPFHEVYFTGLIRDSQGQKMSKTKGNVLDPINLIDGIELDELIEKRTSALMQPWMKERIEKATRKEFPEGISAYGTDALRFTFCALATTGRDIRFDINRLEGYRNFCNKIWNAARYVLMNIEDKPFEKYTGDTPNNLEFSLADRWIQSRLQQTIKTVRQHLDEYRFDLTAQTLYEFIWHEFCDWYLELSKPVLTNPNASNAQQLGTRQTLVVVLEEILRLLHPIMPFITEEIWQQLNPYINTNHKTIMLEAYPEADSNRIDTKIDEEVEWLKAIVVGIRNIRGEMNISPGKKLPLLINKFSDLDKDRFNRNQQFLMTLARLESIDFIDKDKQPPASATALVGKMEILIPMKGLIDVAAETKRLNKEIEKLTKELTSSKGRLSNKNFLEKAPKQVVEQLNDRVLKIEESLEKLNGKVVELQDLG